MSAVTHRVPPHDPQAAAALAAFGEWTAPEGASVVEMIRLGDGVPAPTDGELAGDDYRVSEYSIPTADADAHILALVCAPLDLTDPVPVLYWVHGGGMVAGHHRSGVAELLPLARRSGAAVVSIGYRRAPEHPHPTPVEDCYTGYLWAHEQASELGIDPHRMLIVGGSAGGGLAAATTLLLRDRRGPRPIGQLLMNPMLDDRNDTASAVQLAEWATWNAHANEAGWTALLGASRGGPDVSKYAAPARATDLSELPPTFLDVGSTDLFRDEVVRYANQIWLDGGDCELHVWPGGFHGYENLAPDSGIGRGTLATRQAWLTRYLK